VDFQGQDGGQGAELTEGRAQQALRRRLCPVLRRCCSMIHPSAGRMTLNVLPLPFSLSTRNRPRCRFTICLTMARPGPGPPARAVAVGAAEPFGQTRQVTLADPLALIRHAGPGGQPAQRKVPRPTGHPDGHRHPLLPTSIVAAFCKTPKIALRVQDIVRMGGAGARLGPSPPPPDSPSASLPSRRRSPLPPACPSF
jgi:hypothetical protein